MKLTEADYLRAISVDELNKAAEQCKRGIAWKASTIKWSMNQLGNCQDLANCLAAGTYKLQSYLEINISDPKPRHIQATRLRDRIFQRSLCNNGLYAAITSSFIYDNCACQIGKGLSFAIERLKWHLRQHFREVGSNDGYYLKLDVKKFFDSTPHSLLKELVSRKIKEKHFCMHLHEIIDSFRDNRSPEAIAADRYAPRGIGLGSQISQLLQLLYLDQFDHFVKEQLHAKHYIRYMDDMVFIVKSKQEANAIMHQAAMQLAKLQLSLNQKAKIGQVKDGLTFLKTVFKLKKTGHVKTKVIAKSIGREQHRLKVLVQKLKDRSLTHFDFKQHVNAWQGFAKWRASSQQLKLIKQFRNLLLEQLSCL